MISNSPRNRKHVASWYRGKTGLIAFTLCVAFILVFMGISLSNHASPKKNAESFDCFSSSSSQAFSIEAEVELSDGMDQNEAVNVAISALNSIRVDDPEARELHFSCSANLGSDGLWAVKLEWARTIYTHPPGHWSPTILVVSESFEAIVDPINRTVVCSFS